MPVPLRVLIAEDSPDDAELLLLELSRGGFETVSERVETADGLRQALAGPAWDLVLSDHSMPGFGALEALAMCREADPEIPFIVMSGTMGEEQAVEMMRADASDYMLKSKLTRLCPAIRRELREAQNRRLKHAAEREASLLAALVNSSEDAILRTDQNGCIESWNPAAERLFGYSAAEAIGQADIIVPQEQIAEVRERDRKLWSGEKILPFETVRLKKDGTPVPVSISLSAITIGDRVVSKSAIYRDITEKKNAENALRTSEVRYRTLIEATAAIVWNSPPSGEFDTLQPAWTAFTGQSLGQHKGWGWLNAIHPDDREKSARAWAAAVAERGIYSVEHRLRRVDGEYRHMFVRAVPILDPGGEIREWVGVHTDVTEQKKAEDATRESEERFRAFMDNSPAAADIKDLDGRFLYVNAAWLRQFGSEPRDWHGKTNYDFWPRETADLFRASDELCLSSNTNLQIEETGLTSAGEEQTWMVMKFPLFASGARRIGGMAWNITDRKRIEKALQQSQHRLHHVLASSPAILFTLGIEGKKFLGINWISENLQEILGYTPNETFVRDWWVNLLHPDEAEAVRLRTGQSLFNQGSSIEEFRFRHRDGSYRWTRHQIRVIRNEMGEAVEAVGAWSDITERKLLQDQFHQAQKMEAFGQLAGGVAHDFNNLLTIINGYSDLVLQSLPKGDPSQKLVAEIYKAGERSAGLTRQLLAFSRQQVLAPEILNLNEVVAETDKMLRRLIGEDIRLTTTLDSEPWAIRADAGQIEQVLLNLAVNARDAMPQGGRLTIETRNIELDATYTLAHKDVRPGPYVLLSVTDTGTGMTREIMLKIFEPFFTTKEAGKGTGLGLATVYGIVKQSGGHIAVYSEVGVGTTFKVYLPQVEGGTEESKPLSRTQNLPRGTETVLLAEDEAGVRELSRYILEQCGYTVLEAADGIEAYKTAVGYSGPIHVLITDVVMPGTGGRVLAEQLTERYPKLRVLFVSGYTDDAVIRHGVLRDGVHFLQKPYAPVTLANKVREVLDAPAKM